MRNMSMAKAKSITRFTNWRPMGNKLFLATLFTVGSSERSR